MTSLLTLDLATRIGWAHWQPGMSAPKAGNYRLPSTGPDVGRFLAEYERWLEGQIQRVEPDVIVFEAPWVGPKTSQNVARKLMNLAGMTELICYRPKRRRYFEANNSAVRKHFCGRGSGGRDLMKQLAMRECETRGWRYTNDDEADALAVMDFAVAQMALDVPWRTGHQGPLFSKVAAE